MARYKWLVFTNCAEGRDADFNRWYDEIHLPDVLRVPGIVEAARSRLDEAQLVVLEDGMQLCGPDRIGAKFRYLAVYVFDTEDPSAVIEEVIARAGTPRMEMSDALAEVWTVLYRDR